jgi:site-specific DNA recombinase
MANRVTTAKVPGTRRVVVFEYARYSTDLQNERSIDDQFRGCERALEKAGFEKCERRLRFSDEAISGASMRNRPGLQDLLRSAQEEFERGSSTERVLVVESISRLGRSIFDANEMVTRLYRDYGFRIITVDGKDSDQPTWKVAYTLDALMADTFLDHLKLQTSRGIEGRMRKGFHQGRPATGYRKGAKSSQQAGKLIIDPEQADVVKKMFEWAAEGLAMNEIGRRANALGLVASGGGIIDHRNVRRIITNPIYKGQVWYREKLDEKGKVIRPAEFLRQDEELRLVSDELWEKAQDGLADASRRCPGGKNRKKPAPGALGRHLLSGTLTCNVCGGSITACRTGPRGIRYGCERRAKATTLGAEQKPCSNSVTKYVSEVDSAVVERVLERFLDEESVSYVVARVEELVEEANKDAGKDRKKLEKEHASVTRKLRRLIRLAEQTDEFDELLEKLESYKKRKAEVERDLAQMDEPLPRVTVLRPAVIEYLQNTVELLQKSPERSRHVLANLIEKGRFIPMGRGKAEIRFTLRPFGVEETLSFLGPKRTSTGTSKG